MKTFEWQGSMPALVTPFRDGRIDEDAFRAHVEWQVGEGSEALVPCGTTGESPVLSPDEHRRLVEITVEVAAGRVPVIAGCGSNNTATVIAQMRTAADAGADAALVVVPYYNKPSQAGLLAHYRALAEASPLPIILYDVPGRTVTGFAVDTVAELAKLPTVIGIKDATGDLGRVSAYRLCCGPDFVQLSGDDPSALGYLATGGHGCISVTANVAPRLCADLQRAAREGRWDEARTIQDELYPLHAALFTDSSPGPAKYALSRTRGLSPDLRLPLVAPSEASRRAVDAALAHAGLA